MVYKTFLFLIVIFLSVSSVFMCNKRRRQRADVFDYFRHLCTTDASCPQDKCCRLVDVLWFLPRVRRCVDCPPVTTTPAPTTTTTAPTTASTGPPAMNTTTSGPLCNPPCANLSFLCCKLLNGNPLCLIRPALGAECGSDLCPCQDGSTCSPPDAPRNEGRCVST